MPWIRPTGWVAYRNGLGAKLATVVSNQVPRPLLAMINLWQSSNICVFCSERQGEVNALIKGGEEGDDGILCHVFYLQILA